MREDRGASSATPRDPEDTGATGEPGAGAGAGAAANGTSSSFRAGAIIFVAPNFFTVCQREEKQARCDSGHSMDPSLFFFFDGAAVTG